MGKRFLPALALLAQLSLNSCSPYGSSSSAGAGNCTAADGSVVNTYQIYGEWKLLSPYTPVRSTTTLQSNYNMLIIESGVQYGSSVTPICAAAVVNGGLSTVIFNGVYQANLDTTTMAIQYKSGTAPHAGGTVSATYSFSGSCDQTQMVLSYTDGTAETYQFYSQTAPTNICNPGG